MSKNYRILSCDQAMKTTGWAIWENKELLEYGTFTIPANKPIEQRLQAFVNQLNELLNKYTFQEIFFEDIQQQRGNVETYKKLAYIQAILIFWCYNNDLKFTILAPSHWRSVLKTAYDGFGFGRARIEQKQKAIEFCKQFLNIDVTSDEADAICLGKAGLIEKKDKESAF